AIDARAGQLRDQPAPFDEAEAAEPVVGGNEDDALPGKARAVIGRQAAGAGRVGAAVDPEQHGMRPARNGCPDVEVEAVLAPRSAEIEAVIGRLHRPVAKTAAVARLAPRYEGLRRPEAQQPD